MASPGREIDVKTRAPHLIAVALINHGREQVLQLPGPASEMIQWDTNEALGGPSGQVHDDEAERVSILPAPAHEIHVALVVGPARAFTKPPPALQDIPAPQGFD
jgi:hypothetical protein